MDARADFHAEAAIAVAGSAVLTGGLAALSGMDPPATAAVTFGAALVSAVWIGLQKGGPLRSLAWVLLVLALFFAASGSTDPIDGEVGEWYSNLPFEFVESVSVDQFVLGLSATLFLTASTNQIVRLVLGAKGLLRFPELRSEGKVPGPDSVTEYFLIGTLTSLFVASVLAVLVLAGG